MPKRAWWYMRLPLPLYYIAMYVIIYVATTQFIIAICIAMLVCMLMHLGAYLHPKWDNNT